MADGYGAALYPYSDQAVTDPASMVPVGSRVADWASQTWPAKLAQSVYGAVTLPGDVATGKYAVAPTNPGSVSEEDIAQQRWNNANAVDRSMDLASILTGGGYALPAERGAAGMGIRAYHGSPHDFEKFDLAKIGSGEGAQAYGHGLYFAENPNVAGAYKLTAGGSGNLSERIASQYLTANNGDAAVAAAKLRTESKKLGSNSHAKAADLLDANAKLPGHMYEVDIAAHPDQFLDWDKPLSQQSHLMDKVAAALPDDPVFNAWKQNGVLENAPIASIYKGAAGMTNADVAAGRPAGFSEALRNAGIPGIKYLDQGSRGTWDIKQNPKGYYAQFRQDNGVPTSVSDYFPSRETAQQWADQQGSRNYVVFNPDIINIIRKYGWSGLAGLGGAELSNQGAPAPQL